jgi:hypothetical protein
MTALTYAIVSHDLPAIEAALRAEPALAMVAENGWLPLEWAQRTGNLATLMRVARLLDAPGIDHRAILLRYVREIAGNHFGGGGFTSTAEQVWEQAVEGLDPRPFSKEESEVHLAPGTKSDIAYFLRRAGIQSKAELRDAANAL